jgi:signal transduction histidine kinase
MKSNPSYYLLLKNRLFDFTSKTAAHGARYLLVKLAKSHHLNIALLGSNAQFLEHQLSIYQSFSPSDATLGAFHYTAKYKQQGKVLIVHSYFDHCGHYLLSHVRYEGHKQAILKITEIDASLLSDIAQRYLEETLKTLMSALFSTTQQLNIERKQLLTDLEEKSHLGVNTREYLSALRQTIDRLSSHLNLLIDIGHEQAVVVQLEKQVNHSMEAY